MKTVLMLGVFALATVTKVQLPFGTVATEAPQPLTAPPHVEVSFLAGDQRDPLGNGWFVEN